jgi:hypothetical protein
MVISRRSIMSQGTKVVLNYDKTIAGGESVTVG